MAKNHLDSQRNVARLRWEFLRRDPDYIETHKSGGAVDGFGLLAAVSPDKSFDDLKGHELAVILQSCVASVLVHSDALIENLYGENDILKDGTRAPILAGLLEPKSKHTVTIQFNIEAINSIDGLKQILNEAIDVHVHLAGKGKKPTSRMVDFDEYINLGDEFTRLRGEHPDESKHAIIIRIAKQRNPEAYEPGSVHGTEHLVKQVRRAVDKFFEMTQGKGYRKLTYP